MVVGSELWGVIEDGWNRVYGVIQRAVVSIVLLLFSGEQATKLLYFLQYGWQKPIQWATGYVLEHYLVDGQRAPSHVAVIMDGNRRFARSIGLRSIKEGHERGAEKLGELVDWCLLYPRIRELTVWALSTDNLTGRSEQEIADLWRLCEEHLPRFTSPHSLSSFQAKGVAIRVIGERQLLPPRIRDIVAEVELKSHHERPRLVLNVALAYGGREEIVAAARAHGPDQLARGLYTLSPPDLIIRSGGEMRLSGFLMWGCQHAELYFSSLLWPVFSFSHFLAALFHFQLRNRRYGR